MHSIIVINSLFLNRGTKGEVGWVGKCGIYANIFIFYNTSACFIWFFHQYNYGNTFFFLSIIVTTKDVLFGFSINMSAKDVLSGGSNNMTAMANATDVLFGFELELLRAQPCWFTLN